MSRARGLLNPGGLVYGTILVATLLAAESPKRETYAKTVAAVASARKTASPVFSPSALNASSGP